MSVGFAHGEYMEYLYWAEVSEACSFESWWYLISSSSVGRKV